MLFPNFSVFVPGMPRERERERARERERERERERVFKVLNVYLPFIKILFIKILAACVLSRVARR
jgi:hypothetical protein